MANNSLTEGYLIIGTSTPSSTALARYDGGGPSGGTLAMAVARGWWRRAKLGRGVGLAAACASALAQGLGPASSSARQCARRMPATPRVRQCPRVHLRGRRLKTRTTRACWSFSVVGPAVATLHGRGGLPRVQK